MQRTPSLAAAAVLGLLAAPPRPGPRQDRPTASLRCCPTQADYTAVVRAFAHGDRAAATRAVAYAPAEDVERAVDEIGGEDQWLLEAASAMHVALAASAIDAGDPNRMLLQLRRSDTVFRKIPRPSADPAFLGTWYIATAELCLDAGYFRRARALVAHGLLEKVTPGRLLLAQGIVEESEADSAGRLAATYPESAAAARRRMSELAAAENAYRRARIADPDAEDVRLRLGRVLSLEGKTDEARTTLEGLAAASRDTRVVYLADLFLAELAVARHDREAAVREYSAAMAAAPSFPLAYIGLSNVAAGAGDWAGASEWIRQWRAHHTTVDPWVSYRPGLDELEPTLERLVAMVSR